MNMKSKLAILTLFALTTGVAGAQPNRPLINIVRRPGDAGLSDNALGAIIVSVIAFAVGWAVWVVATNIRRGRAAAKAAELQTRLLDRFTANQELIAFLEGESGRRYFEAMEIDMKNPAARILNGLQLGIVLLLLGISLLIVRAASDDEIVRIWLLLTGVPGIAIGAGFLISAGVSHRLSESWGLLQRNRRQP